MPNSATARIFLKLNCQFSALNGVALLLVGHIIAPILFTNPAPWATVGLRGLGMGLLGFSALLYVLSKNKYITRKMVNEIVVLDAIWVLGSVVLVALFGDIFSVTGIVITVAVAVIVAFFAIGQFIGASKIMSPIPIADVIVRDGNLYATVKRIVDAPAEKVWDVMTDHPAYADVASNIAKVEVMSGDGLGMKRRCYGPKGENWEETCDLFEPGKSFGFQIHTEANDYPYPIAKLSGRWSVEPRDKGAEFDIEIVATPKGNAFTKWLFTAMAKQQFKTILIDLADAWADRMEREA